MEENTKRMEGSLLVAYDPALLEPSDPLRVYTFQEIASVLPGMISLTTLENQREAYVAYSSGKGTVSPVQTLGQLPAGPLQGGPGCQVCVKTGYINEDAIFVSKIAGGGAKGYGNTGCVVVSSQKSLRPLYVLQDNALLTEIRTAAAACLVTRYFLPQEVSYIGIVGASVQAFWQLRFLTLVTHCRNVLVMSRSRQTAETFVQKMKSNPFDAQWNIEIANSADDFRRCQIIHTLTTSREPVLYAKNLDLTKPVHISAVGADSPGKRELGDCVLGAAGCIAVDSLVQSLERGEGQYCDEEQRKSLVEVGSLLVTSASSSFDRSSLQEGKTLTIFDTSGIALQDVCIAKVAIAALEAKP